MKRTAKLTFALALLAGLPLAAQASEPAAGALPQPRVEVIALDSEQVEKLRQERQRQLEERARLREEHRRSIDAILSTSS